MCTSQTDESHTYVSIYLYVHNFSRFACKFQEKPFAYAEGEQWLGYSPTKKLCVGNVNPFLLVAHYLLKTKVKSTLSKKTHKKSGQGHPFERAHTGIIVTGELKSNLIKATIITAVTIVQWP